MTEFSDTNTTQKGATQMQITSTEAEESLAAIRSMTQKMRRAAAGGGAHYFLILWGIIWFLGFLGSHFFTDDLAGYIWLALDILGGFSCWGISLWLSRRVHKTGDSVNGRRIGIFWASLFVYCGLTVWIARPPDGKQLAMLIVIFVMIGWMAMGLIFSLSIIKFAFFITALALSGYFLLPDFFYLWMALLGGGAMIGCGLFIRFKWKSA